MPDTDTDIVYSPDGSVTIGVPVATAGSGPGEPTENETTENEETH